MSFPSRLQLSALGGALTLLLALPAAASARAVLVAGGAPGLVSVDQSTGRVASPLGLGGPAVAVTTGGDGARAYVGAGRRVATVEIADRRTAGFTTLRIGVTALASSSNGSRLLAGRRGAVDVLVTAPLPAVVATIGLGTRDAPLDRHLPRRRTRRRDPRRPAHRRPRPRHADGDLPDDAHERDRRHLRPGWPRLRAAAHPRRRASRCA